MFRSPAKFFAYPFIQMNILSMTFCSFVVIFHAVCYLLLNFFLGVIWSYYKARYKMQTIHYWKCVYHWDSIHTNICRASRLSSILCIVFCMSSVWILYVLYEFRRDTEELLNKVDICRQSKWKGIPKFIPMEF